MNRKLSASEICRNQDGIVTAVCLMILLLVTILGVMSVRTSTDDLQITTNHQIYSKSFYAAEAAKAYVWNKPDLYGSLNITPGNPVDFPDSSDPLTTTCIVSPEQTKRSTGRSSIFNPPCRLADRGSRLGNSGPHLSHELRRAWTAGLREVGSRPAFIAIGLEWLTAEAGKWDTPTGSGMLRWR